MPQDPETHQEVQRSADRLGEDDGGRGVQNTRHEDTKGTVKQKERVVRVKERAQVLGARAAEATRRVPPAAKPAGLAVGAVLTGSLGLLLRRRRKETLARKRTLREERWRRVALGLGALLLIGRKVRSRRRRS